MVKKDLKVCIVSFPWASKVPYSFLSDLAEIMFKLTSHVLIIAGNPDRIKTGRKPIIRDIGIEMHYVTDIRPKIYSVFLWAVKCFLVQLKVSFELIKSRKDIDIVIFYLSHPYYLLPLATAKVLGKKTIEIVTRSRSPVKNLYTDITAVQDFLCRFMIDYFSPESATIAREQGMTKYPEKLLPISARFLDTGTFLCRRPIPERKAVIGYIGRLKREKGVMRFTEAIPKISEKVPGIRFFIAGEGDLLPQVLDMARMRKDLDVRGWIPHAELSTYLNDIKILVLPSESEGLPTIVLEAMACGTIVLSTSVGGVADIIKDGETGFILETNSPECIAGNITRILNRSDLETISSNASNFIKTYYTFDSAVERYGRIISLEASHEIPA